MSLKNTLFHYSQLLKIGLSTSVVFSAVAGYLLGVEVFSFSTFCCLIVGGFLVTGSANGFNQILENPLNPYPFNLLQLSIIKVRS